MPGALSRRYEFHDVNLSATVLRARQALAVDERRMTFEPCLWEAPDTVRRQDERSGRVQQVWFAGVHSDVGGGYPESGLSDTALLWMVTEAKACGLVFDDRLLEVYLDCGQPADPHRSLRAAYQVMNRLSRLRAALPGGPGSSRRFLGDRRRLDPPPLQDGGEWAVGVKIASSVVAAYRADPAYRVPNLVEYDEQTAGFAGCSTEIVALPHQDRRGALRPARPGG